MFKQLKKDQWIKVYDLKKDKQKIKNIQDATLNTEDYGIRPDIALFGSKKWWRAIASGQIPKQELNGIISKVYMSGHNDYPEFEVESNGEKTQWTRENSDDKNYQVGRNVKIEYVIEKSKKAFGMKLESESVLAIYIEQPKSSQRE